MADRYQDRPFPADGFGRGGNQQVDADPLAELARLIGQNDPFAASGRATPQAAPRAPARPAAPDPSAGMPPAGPPTWMQRTNTPQPAAANPFADMGQQQTPQPPAFPAGLQDPRGREPDFPQQDFAPAARQQQGYPNGEFADQLSKLDYSVGESRHRFAENDANYDDNEQDSSRYDDALFGQMGGQQGYQGDNDFQDGQYGYQDGYEEGEEEERPRRRSGMSTVLAVLTLAVVGTGGAYGYKTYISTGRTGEPPIIRADNTPTKIMAQQDPTPKVPDRLLGNDGGERLVSREETPMDVNANARGGNPRVVFPQTNQSAAPPPTNMMGSGIPTQMANANGTLPNSDPRPIKTLSVTGGNQPGADPGGAAMANPPAAKPAAMKGKKSAANANASANTTAADSPMAISPQPAAPATAPARIAAAVPVTEQTQTERTGGYLVSISSQASEAEAMTSYKAVQDKYGAVLGKYEPIIKRMDLGDKGGVKYRAAVGPFATKEEANKMCGTLKTAGGQCFPFSNN